MNIKRKFFWIFPLASLGMALVNLAAWRMFESLLWFFTTILVGLIFIPITAKAEEKDVPVYQVFGPILPIPIFFTLFAYMDFSRLEFLTTPQVWIYSIVVGIGFLGALLVITGKNSY